MRAIGLSYRTWLFPLAIAIGVALAVGCLSGDGQTHQQPTEQQQTPYVDDASALRGAPLIEEEVRADASDGPPETEDPIKNSFVALNAAGLVANDGAYVWQDGDRSILLRHIGAIPPNSRPVDRTGEAVDFTALSELAAPSYADGDGSELGGGAWFVSDTGQLYLLVGGVTVLFADLLQPPAIDAILQDYGIAAERV